MACRASWLHLVTLEGEQKQLLESAVSSPEYMSQVVNDVLDYGRAAAKIQLSLKPFSPGRLIDELIQLMRRSRIKRLV